MSLRGSTHRQGDRRGLIALVVASCALLAAPAGAAAASISGQVTEAGTASPLAAKVLVYGLEGGVVNAFAGFAESSPSTGAYAVNNLPAGEYKVEFAGPRRYFPQYYDGAGTLEDATALVLAADEDETGVDAALVRGGSIEGTVTAAATGQPAAAVSVCAFDATGALWACDETHADGTYEVTPLETGDYRLRFWPDDEESLLREYYADKPTLAEATPIHVVLGEAVTGKDAALLAPAQPPPPPTLPPLSSSPPPPLQFVQAKPTRRHRPHCRKGFRKRKVKGKVRCVKVQKKRHHHRAAR